MRPPSSARAQGEAAAGIKLKDDVDEIALAAIASDIRELLDPGHASGNGRLLRTVRQGGAGAGSALGTLNRSSRVHLKIKRENNLKLSCARALQAILARIARDPQNPAHRTLRLRNEAFAEKVRPAHAGRTARMPAGALEGQALEFSRTRPRCHGYVFRTS